VVTVELWVPCRAPNLNDLIRAHGRHHHAYDKLKKDWAKLVAMCVRGAPQLGRCSVHFELVEPSTRRDPDNIAAGASKLVLDGLVKAGVLEGDGWKHIAGLSFSWRVGNPAGVRVVLTESEALEAVRT
jgi:Holliday junction resolvase RusA-like endonuclease